MEPDHPLVKTFLALVYLDEGRLDDGPGPAGGGGRGRTRTSTASSALLAGASRRGASTSGPIRRHGAGQGDRGGRHASPSAGVPLRHGGDAGRGRGVARRSAALGNENYPLFATSHRLDGLRQTPASRSSWSSSGPVAVPRGEIDGERTDTQTATEVGVTAPKDPAGADPAPARRELRGDRVRGGRPPRGRRGGPADRSTWWRPPRVFTMLFHTPEHRGLRPPTLSRRAAILEKLEPSRAAQYSRASRPTIAPRSSATGRDRAPQGPAQALGGGPQRAGAAAPVSRPHRRRDHDHGVVRLDPASPWAAAPEAHPLRAPGNESIYAWLHPGSRGSPPRAVSLRDQSWRSLGRRSRR